MSSNSLTKRPILDTPINGFYVMYTLFVISMYFEHINLPNYTSLIDASMDALRALVVVGLVASIFFRDASNIRSLFRSFAMLAIGFLTWLIGGSSHLFWLVAFVLACGSLKLKTVSKIIFVTALSITVLTFVLWQVGIAAEPNYISTQVRVRSTFGYGHPNALGLMMFMIALSYSAMNAGRLPLAESCVCLIAFLVINFFADSRTFAFSCSVLFVFNWFYYFTHDRQKIVTLMPALLIAVFLVLFGLSMYLMVNFNRGNSVFVWFNEFLSGRLHLMHSYYLESPFTLFGADFSWMEPQIIGGFLTQFVVDNAYCYIYLRFGVVGVVIVVAGMLLFARRCQAEGYGGFILYGLLMFMVIAFAEGASYQVAVDFFLLFFSVLATGQSLASADDTSADSPTTMKSHENQFG